MGNSVTCGFVLDHETAESPDAAIIAGNTLKGKVLVSVHEEIKPLDVYLHVSGTELATIQKGYNKPKTAVRFIFTTYVALSERQPGDTDNIQPGAYGFPFSIDLPASLPSSTRANCGKRSSCKIEYKLFLMDKLHVTPTDVPHSDRLFIVSSAPRPFGEVPVIVPPTNVKIKAFGMVQQGTLSLGARISNTQIGRGEKLSLSLACRNINAVAEIERIAIKLVESFYWEVDSKSSKFKIRNNKRSGSSSSSLELNNSSPERTRSHSQDGLGGGSMHGDGKVTTRFKKQDLLTSGSDHGSGPSQEEHRTLLELPDVRFPNMNSTKLVGNTTAYNSCHSAMYEDLKKATNTITLLIPTDARDTYHGQLLVITHHVQITVHMKGGRSRNNPTITIPLRVGFPPVAPEAQAVAYSYGGEGGVDAAAVTGTEEYMLDFPTAKLEVIPDDATESQDIPGSLQVPRLRRPRSRRISIEPPFNAERPHHESLPVEGTTEEVQMRPLAVAREDSFRIGGSSDVLEDGAYDDFDEFGGDNNGSPQNGGGDGDHENNTRASPQWRTPPAVSRAALRISNMEIKIPISAHGAISDDSTLTFPSFTKSVSVPNPSVDGLLQEMAICVEDFDLIADLLEDPSWSSVFANLTPEAFGTILAHVSVENDQPRVAELLAGSFAYSARDNDDESSVAGRNCFTCAYVAVGLRTTADWNRPTLVSSLLPYCSDILTGFQEIQKELNEWERVITAQEFDAAIVSRVNMSNSFTANSMSSLVKDSVNEESKREIMPDFVTD